jgi:copper(I)-binding protein
MEREQLLVNRALLTAALAIFVLATQLDASNAVQDHGKPPPILTVEHAEILVADNEDDSAEGYLTIWNGTNQQISLEAIRSDAFGKISILRTEMSSGRTSTGPVEGIVPVPGHAELTMRPSGIRLLLEDPLPRTDWLADSRLTLVFEGGQELEVTANVVQSRDQLTVHHHGQGDVAVD